MAFKKGLGRLGRKSLHKAVVRVRQIEDHEVRLLLGPGDHDKRFAEVGLRLAWCVGQRHKHLLAADLRGAHIVLHNGVAARECVLGAKPVEDPLGRVPLFTRSLLVVFENSVDDAQPWAQLRPSHWLLTPVARRQRILQHLANRLARQPKLPGHRPPALTFYKNRPPHSRIQFHRLHASGVPRNTQHLNGGESGSSPLQSLVVRETSFWRVVYFYSATSRR